jgi:hypothetical protein
MSTKNPVFSKDMANYAIFILVPNTYNPISNIEAAMCTKCYTNYWNPLRMHTGRQKKVEFILFLASLILAQHMDIDNLDIKL